MRSQKHDKISFISATKNINIEFHHLRHRLSGHKIFVEFHLLFHNDPNLVRLMKFRVK